jgi:hypothetical protein
MHRCFLLYTCMWAVPSQVSAPGFPANAALAANIQNYKRGVLHVHNDYLQKSQAHPNSCMQDLPA